jgi:hypothetical protein
MPIGWTTIGAAMIGTLALTITMTETHHHHHHQPAEGTQTIPSMTLKILSVVVSLPTEARLGCGLHPGETDLLFGLLL